jgi:hypothetical protein
MRTFRDNLVSSRESAGTLTQRTFKNYHKVYSRAGCRCPAEFVFTLNEIGISEWENRKAKIVVVSKTFTGRRVDHGESHNSKQLLKVACLTATEQSMTLDGSHPKTLRTLYIGSETWDSNLISSNP